MAGCLSRVSLPLLLLFISLVLFFVLLVTIQVQVPEKQREAEVKAILQQLAWMNSSLSSLANFCLPCPWNWGYFHDSCYFVSWAQKTWNASVVACKDQKAQLVIIKSAEEQRFLQSLKNKNNVRQAWIGLSDHHNEGAWHWVDNTKPQVSFWNDGEPNNVGDEDCVELNNNGWNDNKCTAENFWICKKPSSPCSSL
ncbi:PREDICTED: CD209 antigen-like protein 2-like [Elephantulus edwardii]|uniref:CD209 antigen-like protein 2-like n=1 Tax=Elephantulus edwardii TaxID=28737 RepID=UPI0003F0F225|nr:PREDICTED: CD209 antigen-like protein 2-like [Elephantulus edwardii]